jgi:hypothetical protein
MKKINTKHAIGKLESQRLTIWALAFYIHTVSFRSQCKGLPRSASWLCAWRVFPKQTSPSVSTVVRECPPLWPCT